MSSGASDEIYSKVVCLTAASHAYSLLLPMRKCGLKILPTLHQHVNTGSNSADFGPMHKYDSDALYASHCILFDISTLLEDARHSTSISVRKMLARRERQAMRATLSIMNPASVKLLTKQRRKRLPHRSPLYFADHGPGIQHHYDSLTTLSMALTT